MLVSLGLASCAVIGYGMRRHGTGRPALTDAIDPLRAVPATAPLLPAAARTSTPCPADTLPDRGFCLPVPRLRAIVPPAVPAAKPGLEPQSR